VIAEPRLFQVADFIRPSDDLPIRSVVLETEEAVIIVWYVNPGQEIAAHIHPQGQDTWTVLSGTADYFQGDEVVSRIKTNDIAVAKPNQVHGAKTVGNSPFIFVSVVAPGDAGYLLAEK
jgi:quercetin dioxygenase-like cupin family protein